MDCQNTMKFELKKGKRIGQVLFIVEGESTEPNLIYLVFSKILGYQMERIYRNGEYRVFHRIDDPYSRVTVINTEESNIKFIDKDNNYLDEVFRSLIEDYDFDIDNAAIYYLFDRDPASNTDTEFIRDMLSNLASSRDVNKDMMRQGLLLLSYPAIEAFVGMNLLPNSLEYCWVNQVSIGCDLKNALDKNRLLPNSITEKTLMHCAKELISSLHSIGIDANAEVFMNSLDTFSETNCQIFEWQENKFVEKGQYGLLSLLMLALIDLGLIVICENEDTNNLT